MFVIVNVIFLESNKSTSDFFYIQHTYMYNKQYIVCAAIKFNFTNKLYIE